MIELKLGEEFMIEVQEFSSAGYRWDVILNDGLTIATEYHVDDHDDLVCGSFPMMTIRIKATTPGEFNLMLSHHRPWLKNSSIETKTYHFKVDDERKNDEVHVSR